MAFLSGGTRSQRSPIQQRKKIIDNLQKEILKIEDRTLKGLITAGFLIKNRSLKQTPIDTGNLRASSYLVWKSGLVSEPRFKSTKKKKRDKALEKGRHQTQTQIAKAIVSKFEKQNIIALIIGFTASYALFVHETNKMYNQGNWKFLEKAVAESSTEILQIIKENAKIK